MEIRAVNQQKINDRGAVAVEMAIILPFFLLLVFGIVELGIMLYDNMVISDAAREGARWGAAQSVNVNHPINCNDPQIQQILGGPTCTSGNGQDVCSIAANYANSLTISFQGNNQTTVNVSCNQNGPFANVTTRFSFGGLGGGTPIDPFSGMTNLTSTSSMYFE